MEIQTAEKCPLFKNYDFGIHMTGSGGSGILLIPKKKIYVPKTYGFGYLALAPYLQEPFNDGEFIEMSDLVRELEEEAEISLVPSEADKIIGRKEPFLHTVLNRFEKHRIVRIHKKAGPENKIMTQDVLSAGENYERVRVYRMEEYKGKDFFSELF